MQVWSSHFSEVSDQRETVKKIWTQESHAGQKSSCTEKTRKGNGKVGNNEEGADDSQTKEGELSGDSALAEEKHSRRKGKT